MGAPEQDFPTLIRKLELTLEGDGKARGRWRRQPVQLDATGELHVSLGVGGERAEAPDPLPPRAPTSVPELSIRSASPSRLARVFERPDVRGPALGLLAQISWLELRDTELVLQLEELRDLQTVKRLLDQGVAFAERVQEGMSQVRAGPHRALVSWEPEPPELGAVLRFRREVRVARWMFWVPGSMVGGLALLTVLLGERHGSRWVLLPGMLTLMAFALLLACYRTVFCPACSEYLTPLWLPAECPRCGLGLR